MSKFAVVYWSGGGNTQEMANAVADGALEKGAEVQIIQCSQFDAAKMDEFDAIAFGCPSMGDEVLEEGEFQPMFDAVASKLKGKKIGLFGSYGWGDGKWMRDWEEECRRLGATMPQPFVICNECPGDAEKLDCKKLGAGLV